MSAHRPIRVVVLDADNGEKLDEQVVQDDYVIICHGSCHISSTQAYAGGTHILTIKGRIEAPK